MKIAPFQYVIVDEKFNFPIENGQVISHRHLKIILHCSNVKHLVKNDECLFFGECFDFENPTFSNEEIVNNLLGLSFAKKMNKINKLSGFFIFILFDNNQIFMINDAAGQLETYIYHQKEKLIVASQPHLINAFLTEKDGFDETAPSYIIENKLNIFDKTPFENISKLIPNFYFCVNENEFHRFFPKSNFSFGNTIDIVNEVQNILEKTIESICYRGKSAIALTAGWDSRMLFATSLSQKVDYYLLHHPTEDAKVDAKIAKQITDTFSKKLRVIYYDLSSISLNEKDECLVWKNNERTQKIAHLMNQYYPNYYLINGNISEVVRNFYDPLPKQLNNADVSYILGLKEGEYEEASIENWRKTLQKNIHLLDAIYWEHKMPNWAGSAKSISNLYNIVVSPFNNRYLLMLLLSTKRKERDKYFHKTYASVLKKNRCAINANSI